MRPPKLHLLAPLAVVDGSGASTCSVSSRFSSFWLDEEGEGECCLESCTLSGSGSSARIDLKKSIVSTNQIESIEVNYEIGLVSEKDVAINHSD
nr:hypothetical protein Itr_chr08CG08110 [Ipomoea trifida]